MSVCFSYIGAFTIILEVSTGVSIHTSGPNVTAGTRQYTFARLRVSKGAIATELTNTCLLLNAMGHAGQMAAERLHLVGEDIATFDPASLYAYLDPSGTTASIELEQSRRVQVLSLVRNVLILFPLVLTWFGLFWATSQYREDLAQHPSDVNRPFLDLWQNGFGSPNVFLTFSHLAIVDVLLFLGLISVGLWADAITRSARAHAQDARSLMESAARDLSATTLELASGVTKSTDVTQWAKSVHQALQEAAALVRATGDRMTQVSEQMSEFQRSTSSLSKSASQIGQQTDALKAAVQSIGGSASKLAMAADTLSTQTTALRVSQDQTTMSMNGMITRIDTITSNTATAAQTLSGLKTQIQQAEKVIEAAALRIDKTGRLLDRIDRQDYGWFGRIFGRRPHGGGAVQQQPSYLPGSGPAAPPPPGHVPPTP